MVLNKRYWEESTVTQVAAGLLAEVSRFMPVHPGKIQPQSCALLIIDMQRCFLDGENLPSAPAIIPNINRLIQAFRHADRPIIFTRHQNTVADAGMMLEWWDDLTSPDDPRNLLDERIDSSTGTVIFKTQYDAFHQTGLAEILHRDKISQVVICGVVTHMCCETTARSAFCHGFSVVFPPDATATLNRRFHLASLLTLCHGFVYPMLADDCIAGLEQP